MVRSVCIVGAGAVGGLVAARLTRAAACQVSVLARPATAEALRSTGIRVEGPGRDVWRVRPDVYDDAGRMPPQDVVFLCTKGHSAPEAARAVAPAVRGHTVIVPLINGIPWWFFAGRPGPLEDAVLESVDPGGLVTRLLPPSQVVGAVVHLSSTSPAPGHVRPGAGNHILLGAPDGREAPAAPLIELLAAAGFDAELASDIRREVWYKLWGNASFNPVSALTRSTADRIAADPEVRALCAAMMGEVARVSERFGLAIPASAHDRIEVAGRLGAFKTSMLQDLEAGRTLEIEPLLGALIEVAERLRVETPFLRAVYGLVRLLDANLTRPITVASSHSG
jgi:2-dehydropantoate 2-reductase